MGHAYLNWAFSEAAVLFLRANPRGQQSLTRLEKKHSKGKAFTVLAHKLARAVYYMFIGKYLSGLPKLDHVILLKEGFKTQLRTPCLSIPFGMRASGMTHQIRDGRLQGG